MVIVKLLQWIERPLVALGGIPLQDKQLALQKQEFEAQIRILKEEHRNHTLELQMKNKACEFKYSQILAVLETERAQSKQFQSDAQNALAMLRFYQSPNPGVSGTDLPGTDVGG